MNIIGVDAGATSTKAVLARSDGMVVQWTQGEAANVWVSGQEQAVSTIRRLVLELGALVPGQVIDSVVAGVAGAGRAEEQKGLQVALARALPVDRTIVRDDSQIALTGAFLGEPGVIVIAGTGSIAYGRNKQGRWARAGGYGHFVGDEGSAFSIGSQAINLCLCGLDGRRRRNVDLEVAICQYFGVMQPEAAITRLYHAADPKQAIAGLAPKVSHLAPGNPDCQRLLRQAGGALGDLAGAVIGQLGLEQTPVRVAVHGGVVAAGHWVLEAMEESLAVQAPGYRLGEPYLPPVFGAILEQIPSLATNAKAILGRMRQSQCPFLAGRYAIHRCAEAW